MKINRNHDKFAESITYWIGQFDSYSKKKPRRFDLNNHLEVVFNYEGTNSANGEPLAILLREREGIGGAKIKLLDWEEVQILHDCFHELLEKFS